MIETFAIVGITFLCGLFELTVFGIGNISDEGEWALIIINTAIITCLLVALFL